MGYLVIWSDEYRDRRQPIPVVFRSWQQRLEVMAWRWERGEYLLCDGDREDGPIGPEKDAAMPLRVRMKELARKVFKVTLPRR